MNGCGRVVVGLVLVAAATACSSGPSTSTGTSTSTSSSRPPSATSTTSIAAPTSPTEPLAVNVTVRPEPVGAGTPVTFTVAIRGPGTLDSEGVQFGDGGTSGANAGMIKCGDTARVDHTGTYTHSYSTPGTYHFSDDVQVLGPPPACTHEDRTATATVIVTSP